jgi:hypothetical protein
MQSDLSYSETAGNFRQQVLVLLLWGSDVKAKSFYFCFGYLVDGNGSGVFKRL